MPLLGISHLRGFYYCGSHHRDFWLLQLRDFSTVPTNILDNPTPLLGTSYVMHWQKFGGVFAV